MDGNLNSFLKYVFEIVDATGRIHSADGLVCHRCGQTYGDFKQTGKLGCEACYTAFRPHIARALKSIHGSEEYNGKIPGDQSGRFSDVLIKRELDEKRLLLKKAVEAEEFEEAARLRDIVNALQDQINKEQPNLNV
ncbi:MAG: UvrB/UvrC motif-containing protein [Defluviitaleaceae bacterium]|nr:UvrB/UvrC motif-containing protein [Defluviitaleaceae bacterium]